MSLLLVSRRRVWIAARHDAEEERLLEEDLVCTKAQTNSLRSRRQQQEQQGRKRQDPVTGGVPRHRPSTMSPHSTPPLYPLLSLSLPHTHVFRAPVIPPYLCLCLYLSSRASIHLSMYPYVYNTTCATLASSPLKNKLRNTTTKAYSNYVKDAERERERLQQQQEQEPDCFHKEEDEAVFCSSGGGGGVCFDKKKRGVFFSFPSSTKTTAANLLAAAAADGVGVCVCVCAFLESGAGN